MFAMQIRSDLMIPNRIGAIATAKINCPDFGIRPTSASKNSHLVLATLHRFIYKGVTDDKRREGRTDLRTSI